MGIERISSQAMRWARLSLFAVLTGCGMSHGSQVPCASDHECPDTAVCLNDRCVEVEGESCGAGTCNARQKCLFGQCFDQHCAAIECDSGDVCEDEQCIESSCVQARCSSTSCTATSCPTGCCAQSTCVPHSAQSPAQCGTAAQPCALCSGSGAICEPSTHQCCAPDCAGQCAGASDGCGGICSANDCAGCCRDTQCLPQCGGACCPDEHECFASACCHDTNEVVAAFELNDNIFSAALNIAPYATQHFKFDVGQASMLQVQLENLDGATNLDVLMKVGFAISPAENTGAHQGGSVSNGAGCLWYDFQTGGNERITVNSPAAALYFLAVHNRSSTAGQFRLGYGTTAN